ncbi:MAG TPA: hypothetical protein VH878_00125 [Thermodesulfobacteriota bacterium]|jgi:hypothetical protein
MNCENVQEHLIDFILDEIDPSDGELVKKHIVTCAYCSKRLGEYKEIRRMVSEETQPQLSSHVLSSLAKRARQEITKGNSPFWRRWFYWPILVPIVSSALAVFVWVYYGQKDIEHSFDESIYSKESVAKKLPITKEPLPPLIKDKASDKIATEKLPSILPSELKKSSNVPVVQEKASGKLRSSSGRVLTSSPSQVNPQALAEKEKIQEESGTAMDLAPPEKLVTKIEKNEPNKISKEEASQVFEIKSINEPATKQSNKAGEEFLKQETIAKTQVFSYREIAYNEQLNLALKQQKEGNCDASIKTNEKLLKTFPSPSDLVKGKVYLSLAECYEEKGELENAIRSYDNLQKISPAQAAFAKDKIEDLKQKLTFFKQGKGNL